MSSTLTPRPAGFRLFAAGVQRVSIRVVIAYGGDPLQRNNRQGWSHLGSFAHGTGHMHYGRDYSRHPHGIANVELQLLRFPGELIRGSAMVGQSVISNRSLDTSLNGHFAGSRFARAVGVAVILRDRPQR